MMQLFDIEGRRKYLTPSQRQDFFGAAENARPEVFTFCWTLGLTGCRISEAVALTANRVDKSGRMVVIESLKQRQRGLYRAVPVPTGFLDKLDAIHNLMDLGDARLWRWSRTTAWRRVKEVMRDAGIQGLYATPKGVRHGFGIKATSALIPLNMTQKWMGHARIETTAVYTNAIGPEEQAIAERMWS
jgi:integrase/recombinase XerD